MTKTYNYSLVWLYKEKPDVTVPFNGYCYDVKHKKRQSADIGDCG